MQPPAQELVARDLHDQTWTFRHIYRGNFFTSFRSFCLFFCLEVWILIFSYLVSIFPYVNGFRTTKKTPADNWLECLCQFQKTCSRWRCLIHKVWQDQLQSRVLYKSFRVTENKVCVIEMKSHNFCLVHGVLIDSSRHYHHQSYPVTACT